MSKTLTYHQAQERHRTRLAARGWEVVYRNAVTGALLKTPHATSPDGMVRLWFKPQAVYVSAGCSTDFKEARSLWFDVRREDTEALILSAVRYSETLGQIRSEP